MTEEEKKRLLYEKYASRKKSSTTNEKEIEQKELARAFHIFDSKHEGEICLSDVHLILSSLGRAVHHDILDEIIDEYDTDGDGELSREEREVQRDEQRAQWDNWRIDAGQDAVPLRIFY